jgi:UDPglucose 6-dehydrogenase
VRNLLAVRIIDQLRRRGAVVHCHDPAANGEARHALGDVVLFDDPYAAARGCHLVLVLTAWEEFRQLDLARLRKEVALPLIVDGVNALDPAAARMAGFTYQGIGRSAIKERTDSVLVSVQ